MVSTLALINEVNLRRTRLVLRWVTLSGSIPGAGHLFQYVTNQPPKANSVFHPSGVGKWVPASARKTKAGMVHSVSVCTRGVQVKLWDPLRTRAIPERLRGAFTTRRYTNPRLPLPLYMPTTTILHMCINITICKRTRCDGLYQLFRRLQSSGCHLPVSASASQRVWKATHDAWLQHYHVVQCDHMQALTLQLLCGATLMWRSFMPMTVSSQRCKHQCEFNL